jgi:hypothetical protein
MPPCIETGNEGGGEKEAKRRPFLYVEDLMGQPTGLYV